MISPITLQKNRPLAYNHHSFTLKPFRDNHRNEQRKASSANTLKQFDGGSPKDNDASTTRTEISTDLEDCSIHERFSFASTSLQSANGGPSTTYAASFDSNIANFPSTIGRTPTPVDVITSTESYEIVSQLTGPKERYHNTYGHSLLDLDEDDITQLTLNHVLGITNNHQ